MAEEKHRDIVPVTMIVRVAPDDLDKVIVKDGRTARPIRTIIAASAQTFEQPSVAIDMGLNS